MANIQELFKTISARIEIHNTFQKRIEEISTHREKHDFLNSVIENMESALSLSSHGLGYIAYQFDIGTKDNFGKMTTFDIEKLKSICEKRELMLETLEKVIEEDSNLFDSYSHEVSVLTFDLEDSEDGLSTMKKLRLEELFDSYKKSTL